MIAAPTPVRRVLIVEDETLISLGLRDLVMSFGHEVVGEARTADEAVSLAILRKPSLVLMDVKLGNGKDGIDAATEILSHLNTTLIFCTAYKYDPVIMTRMSALHPHGILQKPYNPSELRQVMQ